MGTAAVGSAAALSAACTVAPTASGVPSVAPAVVSPTALAPLKLGILVPYTESSVGVDVGLNQKRAADLYLKQKDGRLGGRPVTIVYSAESVETGINTVKVRTLIDTEKSGVLLGGASNDAALVLRDGAAAARLIYIDANATANGLTRTTSPYLFRTSASAWQLSEPLGEWAAQHGATEFFVSYVDESFGTESADAFIAGLEKNGGHAVTRHAVPSGGPWPAAITAIKNQPVKNIFAAFATDDAEGFLTEWQARGMAEDGFSLYGPGMLTEQEVLDQTRTAAQNAITAHFWSADLHNPENTMLVDAFPRTYIDDDTGQPVQLTAYAVAMWDALAALDLALSATGGVSEASVLGPAMEKVTLTSPRGRVAFDARHNPVQDIYIRQARALANGTLANTVIETLSRVTDPG